MLTSLEAGTVAGSAPLLAAAFAALLASWVAAKALRHRPVKNRSL
jgi:hypothetical protein